MAVTTQRIGPDTKSFTDMVDTNVVQRRLTPNDTEQIAGIISQLADSFGLDSLAEEVETLFALAAPALHSAGGFTRHMDNAFHLSTALKELHSLAHV